MRGKDTFRIVSGRTRRITPAYAGKSFFLLFNSFFVQDHPRLCGEKRLTPADRSAKQGSPPPMRGKERAPFPVGLHLRITPAYAGKSCSTDKRPFRKRDHPRLCGEKCALVLCKYTNMGSPPPMRGKALILLMQQFRTRITPAYAGKSRDSRYFITPS